MRYFVLLTTLLFTTVVRGQGIDTTATTHEHSRPVSSESRSVYHVNPWVTSGIIVAGAVADLSALTIVRYKPAISAAEIAAVNRDDINPFDRWALHLTTNGYLGVEKYATIVNGACLLLPLSLFASERIGKDWFKIFAMYLETESISLSLYMCSPLGPLFQNKYRPIVYYDNMTPGDRSSGNNRNSFYSGHTASVATASFFMAKVYSDYHPELGNDKYWLFAAALIPPTVLGYIRIKGLNHFPSDVLAGMGLGALCGILVPELHRNHDPSYSLLPYTSPDATGLRFELALR